MVAFQSDHSALGKVKAGMIMKRTCLNIYIITLKIQHTQKLDLYTDLTKWNSY